MTPSSLNVMPTIGGYFFGAALRNFSLSLLIIILRVLTFLLPSAPHLLLLPPTPHFLLFLHAHLIPILLSHNLHVPSCVLFGLGKYH